MNPRLVSIFTNVGPYHVARMSAVTQSRTIDAQVIELASEDALHKWKVDGRLQNMTTIYKGSYADADKGQVTLGLCSALDRIQPDVVALCGYSEYAMRVAARWAQRRRRAVVLFFETTREDRRRHWIRELGKMAWLRRYVDVAMVGGASHREYLVSLRFAADRIFEKYDVVDNSYFSAAREGGSVLSGKKFLYVGRLSPEKNLPSLVRAFAAYRAQTSDPWELVLVGDGPHKHEIEKTAARLAVNITMPGYLQKDAIRRFYADASCFVLPSVCEPWGLVVNEAAASGLPLIVSDRCGAASELVRENVNGLLFNPSDESSLVRCLARMSNKADGELIQMGQESRRLIQPFSPDAFAENLSRAVSKALEIKKQERRR